MSPTLQQLAERARNSSERDARRIKLIADLRAEGASDALIARASDDATIDRIMDHERKVVSTIASLFGVP